MLICSICKGGTTSEAMQSSAQQDSMSEGDAEQLAGVSTDPAD